MFVDVEPYYLSIGMTHNQFWDEEPSLAEIYRKAHMIRIEQRNQELWMQGLYVHNAFAAVMSNVCRAFSKTKSGKSESYIDRPIRITPLTEQEKREKIRQERIKTIQYFTALQKRFEKEQG